MKSLITKIAIGVLLFASIALGQFAGDTIWTKVYGGPGAEYARDVKATSDGGYIVVGDYENVESYINCIYLLRLDSNGDTLWTRLHYFGPYNMGNSVLETADGGFMIAGFANEPEANGQFFVFKTDANGDTLWTHRYGNGSYGEARYICKAGSSEYIVVGTVDSIDTGSLGYAMKIDSLGNPIWEHFYIVNNLAIFHSVVPAADGGFAIVGGSMMFGNNIIYLVKIDDTGDSVWTATYDIGDNDFGYSIRQTDDGGYVIAGSTYSDELGSSDLLLIKADSLGAQQWLNNYGNSTRNEEGKSINLAGDGGFIIAGWTEQPPDGYTDFWLLKTDSSGNLTWSDTYGGAANDAAYSVAISNEGNFIIAGTIETDTSLTDVYLVLAIDGELPPCSYFPGDFNGDGLRIGGDVTYGVRYFKGVGNPPPDSCANDSVHTTRGNWLFVSVDVNGDCNHSGADITRLVAYFKGYAQISHCRFFTPPPLRAIGKVSETRN